MAGPSWVDRLSRGLARRLLGFRSQMVETSVGPMHLLSTEGRGELPPVLLVHGFGAAAIQWVAVARALRPHVRSVWAVDLPGHGFSHRPERLTLEVLRDGVLETLDRVHPALGPALVVGNSLGGAVALRYVAARPDRCLGAHLLSPGGAPMSADELVEVQRLFKVVTHREATVFLDRLFGRPIGWRGHLMAPLVRRVFRDPALHDLLAKVTDADWLSLDEVRAVARPIRVVWGRQDEILPPAAVSFWQDAGLELDQPDGFGHAPHLATPEPASADILAFLRRCADRFVR